MHFAYFPLDDRPCNTDYPVLLARVGKMRVRAAENRSQFKSFYGKSEVSIISVDRWVYGGLVQSRKFGVTVQEANRRMRLLEKLLSAHRGEVSAFTVLMRQAPSGLTALEQETAELVNIAAENIRSQARFRAILKLFPKRIWNEYIQTRKRNLSINKRSFQLVKKRLISLLILAMDDLSRPGISWDERGKLKKLSSTSSLKNKIRIISGADEMGMILLARHFLAHHGLSPRIFPLYSHANPDAFRLRYDAAEITTLIKGQIDLLGGAITDDPRNADLYLFVHTPQEDQLDVPLSSPAPSFSYRWMKSLQSFLLRGKPCILADVRFANGADATMMRPLSTLAPMAQFYGYSAWNTSANALGMALAQGAVRWSAEKKGVFDPDAHQKLLCLRMLEDWLYQAEVRTQITRRLRLEGKGTGRLDPSLEKELSKEVAEKLQELSSSYLSKQFPNVRISQVEFPWNRLFDIRIKF